MQNESCYGRLPIVCPPIDNQHTNMPKSSMHAQCMNVARVGTLRFNAMYQHANNAKNVQRMHMACGGKSHVKIGNAVHRSASHVMYKHIMVVICHRCIVVSTNNAVVTTALCIYDNECGMFRHGGKDEIQCHGSRCK